jgi:hypothetical protein
MVTAKSEESEKGRKRKRKTWGKTRTLLDVLDVFVSTKGVEGVGVELASDAIEDFPAKMESGLFVIREGSIGSSEDFVQPCAAVQRVDGARLESDNIRSWRGRGLVVDVDVDVDFGTPDDRE